MTDSLRGTSSRPVSGVEGGGGATSQIILRVYSLSEDLKPKPRKESQRSLQRKKRQRGQEEERETGDGKRRRNILKDRLTHRDRRTDGQTEGQTEKIPSMGTDPIPSRVPPLSTPRLLPPTPSPPPRSSPDPKALCL